MHKIDINPDDPEEAAAFTSKHGTLKGRALANRLGFAGKGSATAATALSNYAWNKMTAVSCRTRGHIRSAQRFEEICDRIYREDIQGKVECW
jgi:hypothetical protein